MFFFFFQAEDGIRDWSVTGVQTCALPILRAREPRSWPRRPRVPRWLHATRRPGRGGGGRRRRGRARRALRVRTLLRWSEPVYGAGNAPQGAGALGQDPLPRPHRPSEAPDLRNPLPAFRPRGSGGCGPRWLRVLRGPHRQARTVPVAARTRAPLWAGSGAGQAERRDQDRQRLRPPNPGRVIFPAPRPCWRDRGTVDWSIREVYGSPRTVGQRLFARPQKGFSAADRRLPAQRPRLQPVALLLRGQGGPGGHL